jgi:uncharacterized membrane protein
MIIAGLLLPFAAVAQEPGSTYVHAVVKELRTEETETFVRARISDEENSVVEFRYNTADLESEPLLQSGEQVVLERLSKVDGSIEYLLLERYRLPWLAVLGVLFLALAVAVGGKTGARSVAGLAVSIGVLTTIVVPGILAGYPPLAVSMFGAFLIAVTSVYMAHGVRRRTTLALIAILFTLALATMLGILSVQFARLFGTGSEEALFLLSGPLPAAALRGLLLGGIVIGTLGVLDDIATAQTAAIEEVSRANPLLGFSKLFAAGFSVGREHIASLMNTLALAYVGASLPLLLLFSTDTETPLWVILNSQFLAEEIVRTLVGSTALILAVPVSTFLAAWSFARKPV